MPVVLFRVDGVDGRDGFLTLLRALEACITAKAYLNIITSRCDLDSKAQSARGEKTASKPSKSQQSTSLHLQQLQAIGAERRARLFTHRSSKKGAGRRGDESPYSPLHDSKRNIAPLTKDFQDISLALKASEGQDGDEASNIFVKLVKDMSVMQFDDRASFRVVARSVDGDGEEGDPK